jgi:histidinol-phosphatase
MSDDLAFALELADLADSLTLPRFRSPDLLVERKPNLTLVTDVDKDVERRLRDRIGEGRPGEAVVGEELEDMPGPAGGARWILDPIDGTHNFIRGIPGFATLIAIERDGMLAASVASAPALGRRWWAALGEGAFVDGHPIHVSAISRLEEATLCYTDPIDFEHQGLFESFMSVARRAWRTRGFGDFWQHCLVAEGAVDVAIEPDLALWDVAAVKLIVEEAGGRVTNLAGDPKLSPGSAVTSNSLIHDEVLAAFRPGEGVARR